LLKDGGEWIYSIETIIEKESIWSSY